MVDEPGQDPVEVEPAADVAGDPAQRLGPMELAGRPRRCAARADDDRADRVGDDRRDLDVVRRRATAASRRRGGGRPTARRARDGDGQLRPAAGQDRRAARRRVARSPGSRGRGRRPTTASASAAPRTPKRPRPVDEPIGSRRRRRAATARGDEPVVAELPDRHEVMAVGVADRADARPQVVVEVVAVVGQAGDRVDERQVEARGAPAIERVGLGGLAVAAAASARAPPAASAAAVERPPRRPPGPGGPATARQVGGLDLGGGQEPLEVAQPVAPVAARVDPVVAQPAGVAPRPDRVRVHAEQPGGLGDRQGRVGRSWTGSALRHGLYGRKCEVDAPSLPISQFLPIGPMVPAAGSGRRPDRRRSGRGGRRSGGRRRGSRRASRARSRATASTANAGSPTRPGPWPELRGSPPGPGRRAMAARAVAARARPASGDRRRERRDGGRATPHRTASTTRPGEPDRRSRTSPPARLIAADQRPARSAAGEDAHRLVRLEGASGSAGRPSPAVIRGAPVRVEARDAEDDGVLDRGDLLDAQPDRRRRAASPAGTRSGTSAAVPTDSRGTTTSPSSSASSSTAIASRPSRTSNGDALAAVLDRPASRRRRGPGAGSGGGRAGGGRRPRTRPRRRSGRAIRT